jgi:hypothetical protein
LVGAFASSDPLQSIDWSASEATSLIDVGVTKHPVGKLVRPNRAGWNWRILRWCEKQASVQRAPECAWQAGGELLQLPGKSS